MHNVPKRCSGIWRSLHRASAAYAGSMFACGAFIANAASPARPVPVDANRLRYGPTSWTVCGARLRRRVRDMRRQDWPTAKLRRSQWQEIVLIQPDKKTNFGGRERTFATLSMTISDPSRNRAW